ncbi:MAG: hypothetical protein Hyperionvirus54_2 [Hyperionvirus sp.]|uniref:Uncharacterized protein n=1 Tax=Hyperionvirus sp. TaxID=2487770 RepID=A0A3G5ACN3_9VIRU|nr:MAG: hypothetical protein Hyperionvirus54_2 [Hyperionvirus sp.]
MSTYEKYLIYKKKYLKLKMSIGGGKDRIYEKNVIDESHFWIHQLMEHCLFLHLGLEEANLKAEALDLHNEAKSYLEMTFANKGIDAHKVFLDATDLNKITNFDSSRALKLVGDIERFTEKIVGLLSTNKWIGWIFLSLAKHMLKETVYLKESLVGKKRTVGEEIEFANTHNMEEMEVTAKFLDPDVSNDEACKKVMGFAKMNMPDWSERDKRILKGMDKEEVASYLMLSIKYGEELIAFGKESSAKIDKQEIKSIISPVLAHHNEREFERFTRVLEKLKMFNN